MRRNILAALVAAAALSGCYHVTVVTGAAPSSKVIDKQWQLGWVDGLVPPPEVDAQAQCKQGVAKVETERSFLNGLVSAITYNVFSPMHTEVTCAAGK